MTDKVYYPEVISTYSFPDVEEEVSNASKVTSVLTQEGIDSTAFPISSTAKELLSKTLDTKRKKILGSYSFGSLGAINIGTYESGVSGSISLSPNGITAVNSSGETTFALDGDTGDATFAGTLAAGVVVATGALVVGTNVDIGTAEDEAGVTTIIGNTVTATYVNALNITAKYVVASISISSPSITGGTIVGTTIKTASTGVRVELTANDAEIAIYDSGNDKVLSIDDDGTVVFLRTSDSRYLAFDVPTGYSHIFRVNNTNKMTVGTTLGMSIDLDMNSHNIIDAGSMTMTGGISIGNALDMNGNDINETDVISFNSRDSNPPNNWCIYAYSSGGTYQLRVRLNGTTYSTDLSAV